MADLQSNRISLEISDSFDPESWNLLVGEQPNNSILQSWQWGNIKSRHGWQPFYLIWRKGKTIRAAAMALVRDQKIIPFLPAMKIMYVPHGPLFDWRDPLLRKTVLEDLRSFGRKNHCFFIKIDPQIIKMIGIEGDPDCQSIAEGSQIQAILDAYGWIASDQQIQFKNTFIIDLQGSEDEILARMKPKTRYNIRLAARKKVAVREADEADLDLFYEMYASTSYRDGFIIRPRNYYLDIWKTMMQAGMATAFLAEVQNEPVAGLILFHFHKRSYYFYGMSIDAHREKMPNHLLQWEAIKHSKALGCLEYDLWGAPDRFNQADRMWGVYKFKDGFGGKIIQTIGAYDFPLNKSFYRIYSTISPRIMDIQRKIRSHQIQQEIE